MQHAHPDSHDAAPDPAANMSHDPDTCNPGPTPGNSPDEMSTDSDEGAAQHIENFPLTSPISTTSSDATVTNTGRNKNNRPPLAPLPLPGNAPSPRWPPYPFRPSDQERLLRNTTDTYIITITDGPDGDYYIENVNEAAVQQAIRPPHRSRDSGYDADESSNVSDNEPEWESESSDEGRLGAADEAGNVKNSREGQVGVQEHGHEYEHGHGHGHDHTATANTATTPIPTGGDDEGDDEGDGDDDGDDTMME